MAKNDPGVVVGQVNWELFDENGNLKASGVSKNIITDVGDQYYADRASNIAGTAKTITAVTAANPAIVTTSAVHNMNVGDTVLIAGVTPVYYNGRWAITSVPSATTFGINVGTASTVGTAFGTATGQNYPLALGMKLGAGSTAVAKSGAGAALVTYLANSHQAFDATFPSTSGTTGGRVTTYKVTYAAGKATTAAAITEAVIFTDYIADATSVAANTIARVLLAGIGSKGASDTLTLTWTHTLLGA